VLSEQAEFVYKCTDYYAPQHERVIRYDDPDIGIEWPLLPGVETILSEKDLGGLGLAEADLFA
jgi:dTDP-4-dehydrorhamnose 3,5-epimerase